MKKILLLLISILLSFTSQAQGWKQKGATFFGTNSSERLGWPLYMSDDGNTIIMGDLGEDDDGGKSRIHVFQWKDSSWIQKGKAVEPPYPNLGLGNNITVSADGNIFAIGCEWAAAPAASRQGYVQVYKWNGTEWQTQGDYIFGKEGASRTGCGLHLNNEGNILAVASLDYIEVYDWDGKNWNVRLPRITFEENEQGSERMLALNSTGDILAIGIGEDDIIDGKNNGKVLVYKWENNRWTELGIINGKNAGDRLGDQVDISADGNIIATSAIGFSSYAGSVYVYEWNGKSWEQKGQNIIGEKDDELGSSIDMNDDGTVLVIGSPRNDKGGNMAGKTEVYEWKNNSWVLRGTPVYGTNGGDGNGMIVCTNASGNTFATCSPWNDTIVFSCGKVQVFSYGNTPEKEPAFIPAPKVNDSISLHILFEKSSAQITSASEEELQKLLKFMKENPSVEIELSGHTEKDLTGASTASRKANYDLSLERVGNIKKYLTGKGISSKRIVIKAYGGTHPVSSDPALNRRVVMRIVKI